jgi:hypothetical protein
MKSDEQAHLPPTISEEAIQQLVRATNEQGGAVLVDGQVLDTASAPIREEDLESYPAGQPAADELEWRRLLHHWAWRALRASRDEHPLCVQALDVLKEFSESKAGYRDLAIARARLRGRTSAAGVVGLPHQRSNATSTLACFHSCNPDLAEAVVLTKRYVRMTFEFCAAQGRKRKSPEEGV